jgi:hypothetical protein
MAHYPNDCGAARFPAVAALLLREIARRNGNEQQSCSDIGARRQFPADRYPQRGRSTIRQSEKLR